LSRRISLTIYSITVAALLLGCCLTLIGCTGNVTQGPLGTDFESNGDGLFVIEVDGEYGFIDRTGAIVIEPQFIYAQGFSEGLAQVVVAEGWGVKRGYIDTTGAVVIELQCYDTQAFSEGLAWVSTSPPTQPNNLEGKVRCLIDKTGQIVTTPVRYLEVSEFSEGLSAVCVRSADGWGLLWGYVDTTGKMVIQPQFDIAGAFSGGLAPVEGGGLTVRHGYIDTSGEMVIDIDLPIDIRANDGFVEGLALAVSLGRGHPFGTYGYVDASGEWVVPAQFARADVFSEGVARVCPSAEQGAGCRFIDATGAWVFDERFDAAASFSEGLAAVGALMDDVGGISDYGEGWQGDDWNVEIPSNRDWSDYAWSYIDQTGKIVFDTDFYAVGSFHNGLARVELDADGAWGYIDRVGRLVWASR